MNKSWAGRKKARTEMLLEVCFLEVWFVEVRLLLRKMKCPLVVRLAGKEGGGNGRKVRS